MSVRKSNKSTKSFSIAGAFEVLEGRRLMTTTIPYIINGTSGNDTITLSYEPQPVVAMASSSGGSTASGGSTTSITPKMSTNAVIKVKGLDNAAIGTINSDKLVYTINGVNYSAIVRGDQSIIVHGLDGNDTIRVYGNHSAQIYGDNGADILQGGSYGDYICGGLGVDTVDYSARSVSVNVSFDNQGNDGAAGESDFVLDDIEIVQGGWGNDFINNSMSAVGRSMYGGYGNDNIVGGAGNDFIDGGNGNDTCRGGAGNDQVNGGNNDDVVYGDAGNDIVHGNNNNDRVFGGLGDDLVMGGNGDDILVDIGGGQKDQFYGHAGFDSFWTDAESSEKIMDAETAETPRNIHRVSAFSNIVIGTTNYSAPSRDLLGQNFVDPTNAKGFGKASFAGKPLFSSIGPNRIDVDQNGLGDCYWMASLGAVASTTPNVIKQTVVDLGDGTYAVNFHKNGQNVFMRMDADLAVNSVNGLVFAGLGYENSMWVPILEKAWAYFRKGVGTYESIEGGWPEQSYNALGLTTTIKASNVYNTSAKMASAIVDMLNAGNAVTFVTKDGATTLVGLHVYEVYGVYTDANGVTQLMLRNPWKSDGPNGDAIDDGFLTMSATMAFASFDQVAGGHV